jgi:hypothetical protein
MYIVYNLPPYVKFCDLISPFKVSIQELPKHCRSTDERAHESDNNSDPENTTRAADDVTQDGRISCYVYSIELPRPRLELLALRQGD